ncbi:PadR family transcriptional regulator [Clostridium sp. AWRP]|uniref:PadR family transcriptional regulator n=1 Tax=Clostridium sp. AWRP TaxID=2212991 RepID=UPI000FD9A061|nr:PadR family transcriptional regulator [Clostridium sp. AWRP]AZV56570.1 PadR family transcriptional regulator [Clostridium sp. AWRP]
MSKVNKTKYAILGVLSHISGSGYDIKKFCDSSINYFWNENYGHIYPVLKKMEEEKLITKQVEQTEGRPSKNVYSITEKGRKELKEWIMLPVESIPNRSELLLKISLSGNVPTQNVIQKIENVKEECEKEFEEYSKIEDAFNTGKIKLDEKNLALWKSTVRFGKYIEEAKLKWCDETLKSLENIKDL